MEPENDKSPCRCGADMGHHVIADMKGDPDFYHLDFCPSSGGLNTFS